MTEPLDERVIDGRELEPPEPFVRTMDALDTLEPGQRLLLLLAREPFPLYRALELNGVCWRTERNAAGDFAIRMWREANAPTVQPVRADGPDCGAV